MNLHLLSNIRFVKPFLIIFYIDEVIQHPKHIQVYKSILLANEQSEDIQV